MRPTQISRSLHEGWLSLSHWKSRMLCMRKKQIHVGFTLKEFEVISQITSQAVFTKAVDGEIHGIRQGDQFPQKTFTNYYIGPGIVLDGVKNKREIEQYLELALRS